MTHDDLHQLTGAYVLDSLEPSDRAKFEQHLTTCESCRSEVTELSATVAEIGIGEQTEPPESLKTSVMRRIRETPQEAPHTPSSGGRRWNRAWGGLAVAAALVLAFALGNAWNLTESPDESLVAETAESVVAQEVHMLHIAMAPDANAMSMTSGQGAQSLVYSPTMGEGVLVVENTPAPDDDAVYQVWLVDADGQPQPMTSFRPDGNGEAAVMLAGDLATAGKVVVTMEPAAGATKPSMPVVASADMA